MVTPFVVTDTPSPPATPPPVIRTTKPGAAARASFVQSPVVSVHPPPVYVREPESPLDEIDWANLSQEDKEEFFSWLDEFFDRFLNKSAGTSPARGTPARRYLAPDKPTVQNVAKSPSPPPASESVKSSNGERPVSDYAVDTGMDANMFCSRRSSHGPSLPSTL